MKCFRTHLFSCIGLLLFSFQLYAQVPDGKTQPVFKTARLYNGMAIESTTPVADFKGVVITTTDRKTFFLNREETKQQLDITLRDDGFTLPKDIGVVYYDKNGVPSDNYNNYDYITTNRQVVPYEGARIFMLSVKDTLKPLYILNGREISKDEMQHINPSTIEKIDVLKGDAAALAYGERGRSGVVVITLKGESAIDPIYTVNGKKATKEAVLKLSRESIRSVSVFSKEQGLKIFGEEGKNGLVDVSLKDATGESPDAVSDNVEYPPAFPGGEYGWKAYVERNLHYPEAARKNNIEDIIRVQLVIETDGSVTNVTALNNPGYGLAEEAVRLLKEGPKWIPSKRQNDKTTSYKVTQNVYFKLK